MTMHAGFADDFEAFRRRGEIGETARLTVEPPQPEFGALITVRAAHLAHGRLHADDGRSWPIGEGQHVLLAADREMRLHLTDPHGHLLEQLRVEPRAVAPQLLCWDLPASLDTSLADWVAPVPGTSDCESMTTSWSFDGQPWQPLPESRRIGMPAGSGVLRLRLELRSRHAQRSPRGLLVVERAIELACPRPRLLGGCVPQRVSCHEPVALRMEVQHARHARLWMDGRLACEAASDARDPVVLAHRFTPGACGPLELVLETTDWDGNDCEPTGFTVHVAPRAVQVTVEQRPEAPRLLRLRVQGARPLCLELPIFGACLALDAPVVDLEQLGDSATFVHVAVQNDLGHIERHEFVLPAPGVSWQTLPQFSVLPRHFT